MDKEKGMLHIDERKSGESAKDYVVRQLIYNIVHLNLVPGQQIDAMEMCELLHISKIPLREAELELAQTNLLEIKPKVGVFVSYIDTGLVEEIRSLRSVIEAELAKKACDMLTKEQLDSLWENIALWQMYLKREDEEKIFQLDKEFHGMLYKFCNYPHWYQWVHSIVPHFDRTTILSFRCAEKGRILNDHEDLVRAIEEKDKKKAAAITKRHLERYNENLGTMKEQFPDYFI